MVLSDVVQFPEGEQSGNKLILMNVIDKAHLLIY